MVGEEWNLKISEHAEMGKGTCEHDGLKNPQNYLENLGKKIVLIKNIFRP